MKKLFYLLFALPLLFSCEDDTTDDTTVLTKNIKREFNKQCEKGNFIHRIIVIHKEGNEYIGFITTEKNDEYVISIFADGSNFFYWIIDGAAMASNYEEQEEFERPEVITQNHQREADMLQEAMQEYARKNRDMNYDPYAE
jgi:hypothetical protein